MSGGKEAPYGSWQSPVTADLIVAGATTLGQIALDGDDVYWVEMRPRESGRNVIVRRTPDGQITDVDSCSIQRPHQGARVRRRRVHRGRRDRVLHQF